MTNQPAKILIVDDTPLNLQILANMLRGEGHIVRAAVSGEWALKSVELEPPDLILLDIMMPGMSGYEVCERLKADKSTQHIPIIFISALHELNNKMKAFQVGGVDYITKPFENNEVLARVKTHLTLRTAKKRLQQTNDYLEEEIALRSAELRQSQTWYQTIFENSNDVIFMTSVESNIIDINPICEAIFGYTRAEMLTMKAIDFYLNPQDREVLRQVVDQEGSIRDFELTLKKRGGTFQALLTSTVRKDAEGKIIGYQGFIRDITEQKRAEALQREYHRTLEQQVEARTQALAEANQQLTREIHERRQAEEELRKLSQAVEQMTSAIIITNVAGIIEYVNPQFLTLTGYTMEEVLGQTPRLLSSGKTDVETYKNLWKTIKSGRGWRNELLNRRKDGSVYWSTNTISPVRNKAGEITHFVAIQEDITARKKAEEELRQAKEEADSANRAKSTFLATMSHEIRTPMNSIIGMTSLLLNTPLTNEQRDFAQTVQDSGEGLLTIINDILDFSKVESGRIDLENIPFDLPDCLQDALALLSPKAKEKKLKLAYLFDEGTPTIIRGDAIRLRQILLNLINNAIKFTNVGEVIVSVGSLLISSPTEERHPTYMVLFSVRDTGIGIPPDRLDKLFKPFSQVDASTTRKYGGTGLGLVISQKLCTLMGGKIRVESKVDVGTTFHFTIVAQAVLEEDEDFLQDTNPQLSNRRVLIVDSNRISLRLLSQQVEKWGMELEQTDNPHTAWEWLQAGEPFGAVILEMDLPEMDGLTLATKIRQLEQAKKRHPLPLIMVTAQDEQTISQHPDYQTAQFTAFLSKPIKPSHLFDELMTIFSGELTHIDHTPQAEKTVIIDPYMSQKFPLKILLVEDNATNQKLATLMLARLGYQADIAHNGLEALETLTNQPYDVVLMDVQMPIMDGLEATRQIRKRWPSQVKPPHIIAMTANAMQGDRERCLQAGMDDYISKPIRVEVLVTSLLQAVMVLDDSASSSTDTPQTLYTAPSVNTATPADIMPDQTEPIWDASALDNLLEMIGGDSSALDTLVDSFIEESSKLLITLREAWHNNNALEVTRAAHTIKSSARDFGAMRLSTLCRELEQLGKRGTLTNAETYISQIEAEQVQVKIALSARKN